jgi:CheY-like chemotaxis protein
VAKLLLVEDDNNLREIYQARLSAEGYETVIAQNGEEALVVAKKERPDLIISDVMMPRISGFEMLDILRDTPELRNTKVIMLTALGQAEDQVRAGKLGADKYLVKSQVTLEDIVNCAKDLLAGATVIAPEPTGDAPQTAAAPDQTDPNTSVAAAQPQPPQAAAAPSLDAPQTAAPSAVSPTESAPPGFPTSATTPVTPTTGLFTHASTSSVPPVVPVADPDPLAPPVATPDDSSSAATTDLADSSAMPSTVLPPLDQPDEPQTLPDLDPSQLQTTAAETALVDSQIAQFAGQATPLVDTPVAPEPETAPSTVPPPVAPEPAVAEPAVAEQTEPVAEAPVASPQPADPATTNDQTLANAVDALAAAVNAPPTPVLPPSQRPQPTGAATPPAATETTATSPDENIPAIQTHSSSIMPDQTDTAPVELSASPLPPPDSNVGADQPSVDDSDTAQAATATPLSPPQTPTQAPTASANTEESASDQVAVSGKKVIQPINDITHGPDLQDLLAKEVAREQGTAVSPQPATTDATPAQPTPLSPAQPPQTTSAGVDPNTIAL